MPFNKVGSKGITDGSVATAEFADGVVTSTKLQNGAVTNDKLTNTTFTLSGTSVSLGASATFANKFVDWQSVITADGSTGTTGVAGRGYFINTTSAAHTFTLPASATRGDTITIKDYAGTFATNKLTIARNGHNIQGVANNSLIQTNRASVVLVYVDVTRGWEFVEESNVANLGQVLFTSATGGTVTTSGNFKIHTFTGDGCFVVSQVGNSPVAPTGGPGNVDYLVVAGGGGGGGGAGGFREGRQNAPDYTASPLVAPGGLPVSVTTYPITIGAGSVGQGNNSVFSTITSAGGGIGVNNPAQTSVGLSGAGGSGGGAGGFPVSSPNLGGGLGNSPPVSPPQGNNGGDSGTVVGGFGISGGGGGAGAVGGVGSHPTGVGGSGGTGVSTSIYCSPTVGTPGPAPGRYFAGGGGGGSYGYPINPGGQGAGGTGGGGAGIYTTGANGTANTGGGGGRGQTVAAGAGGSGIVIIRYKFQ